ncbi:MAG TPA: hypothetical protein VFL29_10970 [Candidatus Dormibacteraeota bacterium]|nr:hypothetical protein [Candidatus Dormibacteraeota bacterium]
MDGFDLLLEAELARVLDPIVRTPAPPRKRNWHSGRGGRLRTLDGGLQIGDPGAAPAADVFVTVPAVVRIPSAAP